MFQPDKPYTFDSVVGMVLAVGFIIGMVWLLGYLSSVLVPFVAALHLAYLLNPVASFIQKYVKSRGVAVALTLLGVVVAAAGCS